MERRKLRIKSMIWNIKRKNIQSEQQEEKKIQTNEDSVRSLWDNFKCANTQIIGVPEEKMKRKKLKTYLKK